MNEYKKGMYVELDLESQVEFNRKKNLTQDSQITTLSSKVQQLLQQAPSGFLPRAFYGLTRGNMTYRFVNENIFTIQGLIGEVGDAYEILSRLETETYINAVAVQINTNQIKIIIQGDYNVRTNTFDIVNMRTGYTIPNIELTNTNLMDASYLGQYDANENKQKQITILHDLESGKDNVVFASLDYSEDTIYNWVRIGGYTDGADGRGIFGINSTNANIVFSTVKAKDLILSGEAFNYNGISFNIGDLKEVEIINPITLQDIGNIRGAQGPQGVAGTNGTNGINGITPSIGANNHWFIGDVDTNVNAQGIAGRDGVDGNSFDIQSGLFSTIENEGNVSNLSPEGDPLNMLPTLPQTNISGKAYVVYDPITTPLEPFYCLYWANNGDADWTIIKPYTGLAGKDGKDGNTPYIENNNWYINGQNTGVPVTGPQGPQGIQGEKGLNAMGSWVDNNEYYVDDLVTYNGSAYICIKDHQNITTTPDIDNINWTLFVSKGDKGNTGNVGPAGPTPNISVTVTSLPSTSQPTATTTGTAEEPVINLGIPSANNILYVTITSPETATQGALTEEQVNILLSANENYIIFADEIYKLQDKQIDSGYLTYTHTGKDTLGKFYVKCITITVSTYGWILYQVYLPQNIASISQISNQNLLINGDFRVNQRGETTYTGNKIYTVDRWQTHVNSTVEKLPNGVRLTINQQYGRFSQSLDENNIECLKGKTVTISCKISNSSLNRTSRVLQVNDGVFERIRADITGDGIYSASGVIDENATKIECSIYSCSSDTNIDIMNVEWIKLEVGNVATQFSPRPYGEELALCQRYGVMQQAYNRIRASCVIGGNSIDFCLPIPQPLRTNPTQDFSNLKVQTIAGEDQTGFSFATTAFGKYNGYIIIRATKTNHGMTDATLMWGKSSFIDSEIY